MRALVDPSTHLNCWIRTAESLNAGNVDDVLAVIGEGMREVLAAQPRDVKQVTIHLCEERPSDG